MNCHRGGGFLTSAAIHGLLAAMLMTPAVPPPSAPQTKSTMDVVEVDISDLAGVTEQTFDFDVEKILSRGGRLFPFTQGNVLHMQIAAQAQSAGRGPSKRAFVVEPRSVQPPLDLSNKQLQALLDKCWSRRHRWEAFKPIADIATRYHAERGDLHLLLRGYVDQNSLQPFTASWNPEAKLWTLLSIAADHADFVEFTSQYVARHPSSRSSTELLFLLDKVIQANLEALLSLMKVDPRIDLVWTTAVNPRAADELSALHLYHQTGLGRRGLLSVEALKVRYDEVRVAVLQYLLRSTPQKYRSNDALFMLGEIHWKNGKVADAVGWWRRIIPDARDTHFAASSDVLRIIASGTPNSERIAAALDADKIRWIDASFIRLKQFGYRFDTF